MPEKRFRELVICLSWVILALGFVLLSGDSLKGAALPVMCALGILLYGFCAVQFGRKGRRALCALEALLAVGCAAALLFLLLGRHL